MDALIHEYIKSYPQEVAHFLETCSVESFVDFAHQSSVELETVLPYLSSEYMSKILGSKSVSEIMDIFEKISDMRLAALLKHLAIDLCDQILSSLPEYRANHIKRLIEFDETQVGYYVKKPKYVLSENNTLSHAYDLIDTINEKREPIFVVNAEYELLGTLNLLKLIQNRNKPSPTTLYDFATKIPSIRASSPIESLKDHAALERYNVVAITGKGNHFLGIVSKDLLMHHEKAVIKIQAKSSLEEYIEFSEMIWSGLNKFWGTLK